MCVYIESRHFKTIIITVLGRNSVSITIKHIEKRKHFIQTNNFHVVQWGLKSEKQKHQFEKVGEAAEINETRTWDENNLGFVKLNLSVSGRFWKLILIQVLIS